MWAGALDLRVGALFVLVSVGMLRVFTAADQRRWVTLGLIAVVVSSMGVLLREASTDHLPRNSNWSIEAVVTGDLQIRSAQVIGQNYIERASSLMIRIERISTAHSDLRVRVPARLLLSHSAHEITPGSRITAEVTVLPRIDGSILIRSQGVPEIISEPSLVQRTAQQIRHGLREASQRQPQRSATLLPGLVDGDTNLLDPDIARDMRETNLTHLTAVSGANLALVAGFILFFARLLGVPRKLLPVVAALSIASFVTIARTDPSVMRAAVMASVLILASALDLPAVGLTSLMAAVCILILVDPSQAKRPGFILSVLATAGILIFAQRWSVVFQRWMPKWLAVSLSVPLAAQILCTPYLVLISQQLSLVGIWTNLAVAPAVAPATILGFLAGLSSLLSPMLAASFAWIASLPLWWISWVAQTGAALPFASIRWFPGWIGGLLAAALMVLSYLGMLNRPRWTLIGYGALLITLTLLRTATPWWPSKTWVMSMCDVGQGDGLVLRTGVHEAIVVDAGPDSGLIDRCLNDLGITIVPVVILTHNHADHVEGLRGILAGRRVGAIWVSPESEPQFEFKRITRWAKRIPITPIRIGQMYQWENLQLQALWPRERIASGSVPNNASIVLLAQWPGHSALLLGDVEAEAQAELARTVRKPVDILKVAHHGSANQDGEWLHQLRPQVALISVGSVNPYGHPSSATLARLARVAAHIYRTDRDGSVAISFDTRGIIVSARGHPWWRSG